MLLTLGLFAAGFASAATSTSPIDIGHCEFGEVAAFGTTGCQFQLVNTTDEPLAVSIKPRNPADAVDPAKVMIPVGGSANIDARISVGDTVGEVKHSFRVTITDVSGEGFAVASGFAVGALDQVRPGIAFGNIDLTNPPPRKQLELTSRDIADFRILSIIESPKAVDASIAPDGRTLKVRIRPDAPWAVLDDDIKLAINTPRQKEAWVHVSGDLHGPVSAEKNPVSFGFVAPGKNREVRFDIRHSDGKDFRVGSMELNGINGHGTVSDCEPAKAGCRTIVLHLDDDQKPGIVRGVLAVELPDYDRDLALNVWGILQSPPAPGSDADNESSKPKPKPETKAHDTDTVGTKAEEPVPADADVAKSDPSSVAADASSKSAPERASPAQTPQERDKAYSRAINPPTPPPGTGPLLKWSTATEDSVHGYQIFRSDSADGPFVLQNAKTLLVHPDTGSIYQWRDPNAESGKAYWYYIGVVYKNGKKENLSSPQRTVAK